MPRTTHRLGGPFRTTCTVCTSALVPPPLVPPPDFSPLVLQPGPLALCVLDLYRRRRTFYQGTTVLHAALGLRSAFVGSSASASPCNTDTLLARASPIGERALCSGEMRWTWKFLNTWIKSFSDVVRRPGSVCRGHRRDLQRAPGRRLCRGGIDSDDPTRGCLSRYIGFHPHGPPHICSTNGYERRAQDKPAGPAPDKPATPSTGGPTRPGASGGTALRPFDSALRKAGVYTTLGLGAGIGAIEYAKARHDRPRQQHERKVVHGAPRARSQ